MEKNKLSLSTTIIIASVIIGGFYYATQVSKQKSIERQQQIGIEQKQQEQAETEKREQEIRAQEEQNLSIKQQQLQSCLATAESVYLTNWANTCTSVANYEYSNLQDCIQRVKTIGEATGYGIDYALQNCYSTWGKSDYSADCSLPSEQADKLRTTLQTEKDNCFKKYK